MGQLLARMKSSTTDGNKQTQIYAKDSLDRFGDDLCQLLLSYLRLKDRFRLECVSKQFQRTVFESVIDICIDDIYTKRKYNRFMGKVLTKIAIKCSNIQTIDCQSKFGLIVENITELLDPFRYNCRNLREIYYNSNRHSDSLSPNIWPLFTRIVFFWDSDKRSLIHCHRLSHLKTESLSDVFDTTSGQLLVKNLHKCEFSVVYCDEVLLTRFVSANQTLKSLVLNNYYSESFVELCGQLSRLTQLRELTLSLPQSVDQHLLSDSLFTIGVNCKQLKRLSLRLDSITVRPKLRALDSLRFYPRLKRLHLSFRLDIKMKSLDPLRHCRRLTHLTLILHKICPKLLHNCHEIWPRLQYLSIIYTYNAICHKSLNYISRLPTLQTLIIHNSISNSGFRDQVYEDLLSSSPKLKNIEIRVNNEKKFYSK